MTALLATKAYQSFQTNLTRAGYFLEIHDKAHPTAGAPRSAYRELPRGAVVFAVGAIDAYISEVSAEVMVQQLQKKGAGGDTREVLRKVQAELPALALEVALVSSVEGRLQRIREAIVSHFQNNVTNHGAKAVSTAVQRMGARPADLWSALGSAGYADAAGELDYWTDVRHQIVHQGKKPRIRKPRARDFLTLAGKVAAAVESCALAAINDEHERGTDEARQGVTR